uniref:Short-chain dehydrogenase/reductase 3 n=2 Tax=Steinernema glaseri TaxID=37863 RepID=A0A1I7ZMI0_9BILA
MSSQVGGAVGFYFHALWFFLYSVVIAIARNVLPASMLPRKSVAGKVVLVTGAGNGIGRLLAERFALLGARLVLWDVNEKGNKETESMCKKIGAEVTSFTVDLSDRAAIYAAAEQVKAKVGGVDVLVNNAGILHGKLFLETSDEAMSKLIDVNVKAHFWTLKAFLPHMIERDEGHVVALCSLAGFVGAAGLVDYSTSKYGAIGLMEAIANELDVMGKDGIKTTIVCPTFVQTGMIKSLNLSDKIEKLSPEYVADRIIEATLTNQRWLIMPRRMSWLFTAKGFLPTNVYNSIVLHKFVQPQ